MAAHNAQPVLNLQDPQLEATPFVEEPQQPQPDLSTGTTTHFLENTGGIAAADDLQEGPSNPFLGVEQDGIVSGTVEIRPNPNVIAGVRKVAYYLNGTKSGKVYQAPFIWGGPNGNGTAGFDTRTIADGKYTLSMTYTNASGDHNVLIRFTVANQNTPPPVTTCNTAICGVSNGQTVSGTLFVKPNLQLNPTIRKISYYLNGTLSDRQYSAPYQWKGEAGFDTRTLNNGTYTLSGAYTTSAGDQNFSLTFIVNNTATNPGTTPNPPANPPSLTRRWITMLDEDSAIFSLTTQQAPARFVIEYGLTQSYGQSVSSGNPDYNHFVTLDNLGPNQTYFYRLIMTDAGGNSQTVQSSFRTDPPVPATLFLDFDGTYLSDWSCTQTSCEYHNISVPAYDTDGNTSDFTQDELTAIEQGLLGAQEIFSIFNVTVTNADPFQPSQAFADRDEEFRARDDFYEANRVIQIAIGGTSSGVLGMSGLAGIAQLEAFTRSFIPNTAFVFAQGMSAAGLWKYSAHEAAHTFGLHHQSTYNADGTKWNEYNPGSGQIVPIMGGTGRPRALWFQGTDSLRSTSIQNDLFGLARLENQFGFRPDEYGDTREDAAAFPDVFGTSLGAYGVINSRTDADFFKFTLSQRGFVEFKTRVAPFAAMLDSTLEIQDINGNIIAREATSSQTEEIQMDLAAGTYYLVVRSANQMAGDVGQYWVDATVPMGTTTP